MPGDTITALHIKGLRSIEELHLDLRGLNVLIGENGSGKSSLIEACEILRRLSSENFFSEFHEIHGGLFELLRHGASSLSLGVTVEGAEGAGESLHYEIVLASDGQWTTIAEERLDHRPHYSDKDEPLSLIRRTRAGAELSTPDGWQRIPIQPHQLILTTASRFFVPHPAVNRMRDALAAMEVHVPFELTPNWVARAHGRKSDARSPVLLQPATRLERLASNLPNAFAALRNEFGDSHWQETLQYIRLGLGQEVETINLRAGPAGGAHALWLKFTNRDEQIPPSGLSDGMLAYLAFVALLRLPRHDRTLLAFDEPELHLHPELLVRVLGFFDVMAEQHPVLLATHSDRLLDALQSPDSAVHICEIQQPQAKTRLRRLDPNALKQWLDDYRGVGDLHGAGYLAHVIKSEEPT